MNFGKLSAGVVAAFAGMDIDDAAASADNAARNNAIIVVPVILELMDKGLQAYDAYRLGLAISEGDTDEAAEIATEIAAGAATDAIPDNVVLIKIGVMLKKAGLGALASKVVATGVVKNVDTIYDSIHFRKIAKEARALDLSVEGTKVKGVTKLWDQKNKVYIDVADDIDLQSTLERIAKGEKYPYRNDGEIFSNRAKSLPTKSDDYYREYVVPTSEIDNIGPQRIVKGKSGEIYYTPDHYETFIRVK